MRLNTTLAEMKQARRECERKMLDAVAEFQEATHLAIDGIDFEEVTTIGHDFKQIVDITLRIRL